MCELDARSVEWNGCGLRREMAGAGRRPRVWARCGDGGCAARRGVPDLTSIGV